MKWTTKWRLRSVLTAFVVILAKVTLATPVAHSTMPDPQSGDEITEVETMSSVNPHLVKQARDAEFPIESLADEDWVTDEQLQPLTETLDGEIDPSIPWLWERNRKYLNALARQSLELARRVQGKSPPNDDEPLDWKGINMNNVDDGMTLEDIILRLDQKNGLEKDSREEEVPNEEDNSVVVKRHIGTLARSGVLSRFSNGHYPIGSVSQSIPYTPGFHYGTLIKNGADKQMRNAARYGLLSRLNAKRHIGSAARYGLLPRFRSITRSKDKRHIGAFVRSGGIGQFPHGTSPLPFGPDEHTSVKRHIGALARNGQHFRIPKERNETIPIIASTRVKRENDVGLNEVGGNFDADLNDVLEAIELESNNEWGNDEADDIEKNDENDDDDDNEYENNTGGDENENLRLFDLDFVKRHIGSLARLGWLPPRRAQRRQSLDGGHGPDPSENEGPDQQGAMGTGLKRGLPSFARMTKPGTSYRSGWRPGNRGFRGPHIRLLTLRTPGKHPAWAAMHGSRGVRSLRAGDKRFQTSETTRFRQDTGSSFLTPPFLHTRRIWKRSLEFPPDIKDRDGNRLKKKASQQVLDREIPITLSKSDENATLSSSLSDTFNPHDDPGEGKSNITL